MVIREPVDCIPRKIFGRIDEKGGGPRNFTLEDARGTDLTPPLNPYIFNDLMGKQPLVNLAVERKDDGRIHSVASEGLG